MCQNNSPYFEIKSMKDLDCTTIFTVMKKRATVFADCGAGGYTFLVKDISDGCGGLIHVITSVNFAQDDTDIKVFNNWELAKEKFGLIVRTA